MKQGKKDIVELAQEIQRQREAKRDFVADTRKVEMITVEEIVEETQKKIDADGEFARLVDRPVTPKKEEEDEAPKVPEVALAWGNGDREVMPVNRIAHDQIATRFNIPRKFYRRLQATHPDMLAYNVSEFMKREPQQRMIRTLDNRVRAYLSDRFRPLDNPELFEAVFPVLKDLGVHVVSSDVTDSRMYIKFLAPGVHVDAPDLLPPNIRDPHGDLMTPDAVMRGGEFAGLPLGSIVAGGVISNSEVGLGTLKVERLRFFVKCLNGWIEAAVIKQTHVGRSTGINGLDSAEFFTDETRKLDDAALFSKVKDTISGMFTKEALNDWVEKARAAKRDTIEAKAIPAVVEVVGQRLALPESTRDGLLENMIADGDLSRWGLSNAITAISQRVESYDDATELEAEGNKVLELKARDWDSVLRDAKKVLEGRAA